MRCSNVSISSICKLLIMYTLRKFVKFVANFIFTLKYELPGSVFTSTTFPIVKFSGKILELEVFIISPFLLN